MARYSEYDTQIVESSVNPLLSREFLNLEGLNIIAKIPVTGGVALFYLNNNNIFYGKFILQADNSYSGTASSISPEVSFTNEDIFIKNGFYDKEESFYIFYNYNNNIYLRTFLVKQGFLGQEILVKSDAKITNFNQIKENFFIVYRELQNKEIFDRIAILKEGELKILFVYEQDIINYEGGYTSVLKLNDVEIPFNTIGEECWTSDNIVHNNEGFLYFEGNMERIQDNRSINGTCFEGRGSAYMKMNSSSSDFSLTIRYMPNESVGTRETFVNIIETDNITIQQNYNSFKIVYPDNSEVVSNIEMLSGGEWFEYIDLTLTTALIDDNRIFSFYANNVSNGIDVYCTKTFSQSLLTNFQNDSFAKFSNILRYDYLALKNSCLSKKAVKDLHNAFEKKLLVETFDKSLAVTEKEINNYIAKIKKDEKELEYVPIPAEAIVADNDYMATVMNNYYQYWICNGITLHGGTAEGLTIFLEYGGNYINGDSNIGKIYAKNGSFVNLNNAANFLVYYEEGVEITDPGSSTLIKIDSLVYDYTNASDTGCPEYETYVSSAVREIPIFSSETIVTSISATCITQATTDREIIVNKKSISDILYVTVKASNPVCACDGENGVHVNVPDGEYRIEYYSGAAKANSLAGGWNSYGTSVGCEGRCYGKCWVVLTNYGIAPGFDGDTAGFATIEDAETQYAGSYITVNVVGGTGIWLWYTDCSYLSDNMGEIIYKIFPTQATSDTTLDTSTNYMWNYQVFRMPQISGNYQHVASTYCSNSEVSTYTDWRLPSVSELATIVTLFTYDLDISGNPFYTPHLSANPYFDFKNYLDIYGQELSTWTSTNISGSFYYVWNFATMTTSISAATSGQCPLGIMVRGSLPKFYITYDNVQKFYMPTLLGQSVSVSGQGIPKFKREEDLYNYSQYSLLLNYKEKISLKDPIKYVPHYLLSSANEYLYGNYLPITRVSKNDDLEDTVVPVFIKNTSDLAILKSIYADPEENLRVCSSLSQKWGNIPFIIDYDNASEGITLWIPFSSINKQIGVQYNLKKEKLFKPVYTDYRTISRQTYPANEYFCAYHFDKLLDQRRILINDVTVDYCGEIIISGKTGLGNVYLREIKGIRFYDLPKRYKTSDIQVEIDVKDINDRTSYINNYDKVRNFVNIIIDKWKPANVNTYKLLEKETLVMAQLLKDEYTQVLVGLTPRQNTNAYYIRTVDTGAINVVSSSLKYSDEIDWIGIGRINTPYLKTGVTKIKTAVKNIKILFETKFTNNVYRILVFSPNNSKYYVTQKDEDGFIVESSALVEEEDAWIALNTNQVVNGTVKWINGVPENETIANHLNRITQINNNANRYTLDFTDYGYAPFPNTDYSVILCGNRNVNLWVDSKTPSRTVIRRSYAGESIMIDYMIVQSNSLWWKGISS